MDNEPESLATFPNWADMDSDLFDLVLQKLPFVDRFRSQGVCKNWRSNAKTHIEKLLITIQSQPPLLMLPCSEVSTYTNGLCVANILENNLLRRNKKLLRKFDQGFIGSTKGWLVFKDQVDEMLEFFNPFLDVGLKTNLPERFDTVKFAFWSFPILSDYNNYGIVTLYQQNWSDTHIAYAKCGDVNWSYLGECIETSYSDIVSCNHLVYALSERCYLEAWDFRPIIPTKRMYLKPNLPQESVIEFQNFDGLLYRSQRYLIVSNGELFLVYRFVAYHVRYDDDVVVNEQDYIDQQEEGYSFRYLTRAFYVFKLDFSKIEWVRVEDLGDKVILLGGNESVLVDSGVFKEFEKNSIYFTDDFWGDIDPWNDYGGHDNGIHRLSERSIEWFPDSLKIHPTPFWVIPGIYVEG